MKILKAHFIDSFDVDYFNDMPPRIMPHALAWIANDDALETSTLTDMYHFIRKLPDVVAGPTGQVKRQETNLEG